MLYYDGMVRFWSYEDLPEKIAKLREYQKLYTTDHIKFNTMKLFLDGTNESGNSASLHEHITRSRQLRRDHDGDGRADEVLRALQQRRSGSAHPHGGRQGVQSRLRRCRSWRRKLAAEDGEPWVCQPVFAHCEVVDPSDMGSPAQLGIFINWSCHWSGGYFGEEAMNYYTEEKWRRMYQFNPMMESGAMLRIFQRRGDGLRDAQGVSVLRYAGGGYQGRP